MDSRTRHRPADALEGKAIVILGCGKVGTAVGELLAAAGHPVAAVSARTAESAAATASRLGTAASTDNADVATKGDIVLVTTNDDAIAGVVAQVAAAGGLRAGQAVVHMSGALPLAVLDPAAAEGALVACAHPLQAFASVEDAVASLPGSVFGVTADAESLPVASAVVTALGGVAVTVSDESKSIYHAAAVMASNYLIALEDAAVQLLCGAGYDEGQALKALRPLVEGTTRNLFELGPTTALTGPIVRGDVATVRRHLDALDELGGSERVLYRHLGLRTLDIARRRGTLSAQTAQELAELLGN